VFRLRRGGVRGGGWEDGVTAFGIWAFGIDIGWDKLHNWWAWGSFHCIFRWTVSL